MQDIFIESNNTYNGLETYCVMTPRGHRCGYVVLEKGKIPTEKIDNLEVHGGITHQGSFPTRFDGKFVVGFDCIHHGDKADFKVAKELFKDNADVMKTLIGVENIENMFMDHGSEIRTQEFVELELESLTRQIQEILMWSNS